MDKLGGEEGSATKGDVAQKKGRRFEAIAFSMIYTAITLTHLDKWMVYLLMVLDGFQLFHFSWKENYMLSNSAGAFFNSIGAFTTDYSTFESMFYAAFILVLSATAMFMAIGGLMHRGQFRSIWPLDVIRLLSFLLKTILLIPIVNIFVSGLHCNYSTMTLALFPDQGCFSNRNLFPYIGSVIGLCIIIPFSVISPTLILDARPSPKGFAGTQAQGKTDVAYGALRLALVFVHIFVPATTSLAIVVLICNCMAFGFLFYAYSSVLPFYSFMLNRIRCAFLMASFLSSICAIITVAVQVDETSSLAGQSVTSIVGFLLGFVSPAYTRRRLTKQIYARITEEVAKAPSKSTRTGAPTKQKDYGATPVPDDGHLLLQLADIESIANTRTVERPPIFKRETDVEIACRFVRHNKTPNGKGLMHFIFRCGLQQYPKSVYLYAMYAFYIHEFDCVKEKQAEQLVQYCSRQLNAKFPDRFLLFFIQHSLETALHPQGDDNELTISSHAEYQSLEASARHFHTQTLEELRTFWAYMASANVSVRVLPVFAQKIMRAERKGDQYYEKLIQRFPKSKVMMRMYATWLQQVKNDTDLAKDFFELADQIENAEAQEGLKESRDFHLDDTVDYNTENDEKIDGEGDTDVGDEKRERESFDPDRQLMKKASLSQSNFRLHHSGSFPDFHAQDPDATDHVHSINDEEINTPHREEDKTNTLPSINVFSEEVVNTPHTKVDGTNTPLENDQPVRQTAFLEPDSALFSRRQSEIRSVLISESDAQENEIREDRQAYAKGPRSESNASSSASTKAARMRRIQRIQLQMQLTNEIKTFGVKVAGLCVIFLGMVVGTYIVAVGQFAGFNDQLANMKISTRLGQRFLLLSMSLREEMMAAQANDIAVFSSAEKDYLTETERLKTIAIPYLKSYHENPYWISAFFSQYPNGTGIYIGLNEYGVGTGAFQFALQLNLSMEDFADPDMGKNNYFKFFSAPNAIRLGNALDGLSSINQLRFIEMSNSSMSTLYALIGVVAFTVFASAFGLFHPMIKRSGSTQIKVMKLFTLLSKKACRHIHTNIEEDLENFIATGDDHETQIANEAKLRVSPAGIAGDLASQNSNRKMLLIIAFWLFATLVSTLAVFAPSIAFEIDGIAIVKAITWSDARRYQSMVVLRLALELAAQDEETYMEYVDTNRIIASYNDAIHTFEMHHKLVTTGHGDGGAKLDIPPLSEMAYIQDITTIPGICLLGPNNCGPDRKYNAPIGLTQGVATSGLDNFIGTYIETAKRFSETEPKNMNLNNPNYQFLKQAMPDLREGLSLVVDKLMTYETENSANYTKMLNALFPIAMLIIICSYVAFRRIVRDRTAEMHQIVQLLFSIPYTIIEEAPQLSQYIHSGGVLGLDDKE